MPSEQTDYNSPISVVHDFIRAMNVWELEAWQSQRACRLTTDPSSYQTDVKKRMEMIFMRFCTPKERKFGREGSFQKPPEYDPENERVIDSEVDEIRNRAYVTTHRQALLDGGHYRYTLIRKNQQWRIDMLKRECNGEWKKTIL